MQLFPRAQSGQPIGIPAEAWNAAMDAAEWNRMQRLRTGDGVPGFGPDFLTVLIKNATGSDVPAFGIMGLGSVLNYDLSTLDNFLFSPSYQSTAAAPALSDTGRFCIAQEPIPAGQCGRALLMGVTPCQINLPSSGIPPGPFADVAVGENAYLAPGPAGAAQILFYATGTGGPTWAVVRLGNEVAVPIFWNDESSQDAPPYAVMAVTGTHDLGGGNYVPAVKRPDGSYHREYLVNGSATVKHQTSGVYQDGDGEVSCRRREHASRRSTVGA